MNFFHSFVLLKFLFLAILNSGKEGNSLRGICHFGTGIFAFSSMKLIKNNFIPIT